MSATEPLAGHTYRVIVGGKEAEHFHVTRVHGRRITFGVTATSCLCWNSTRLRWRKAMQAIIDAGHVVTEEPTP